MLSGNQRRVRVRKLGIVLVCLICVSVSTDYTKTAGNSNNDRVRRVVDEALRALGGAEHLQRLTSITMKGNGEQHASAESQGYAYGQRSTEQYKETLVASVAGETRLRTSHG